MCESPILQNIQSPWRNLHFDSVWSKILNSQSQDSTGASGWKNKVEEKSVVKLRTRKSYSTNFQKQVYSANDASEVDILGLFGTFWDILGQYGTIPEDVLTGLEHVQMEWKYKMRRDQNRWQPPSQPKQLTQFGHMRYSRMNQWSITYD